MQQTLPHRTRPKIQANIKARTNIRRVVWYSCGTSTLQEAHEGFVPKMNWMIYMETLTVSECSGGDIEGDYHTVELAWMQTPVWKRPKV